MSRVIPAVAILLFSLLFLPILDTSATASSSCIPASNPFIVQSASWANPQFSPSPGQSNLQFAVDMVYMGGCQLTWSSFQVQLSQPFTSSTDTLSETDYQVNLPAYYQFQLFYTVNIADNASLGLYHLPLTITYSTQNITGFVETTQLTIPLLGSASINIATLKSQLLAGETNNIQLAIQNTGTGNASQVSIAQTQPVQGISIITPFPKISSLSANSTFMLTLQVFVSNSLSQQAINLPLTVSFYNSYGNAESEQLLLGFNVSQSSYYPQLIYLSISTLTPSITIGQRSLLAIQIRNTGSSPFYSPVLSLNLPSGFAVVQNSSYSNSSIVIPAHSSFVYNTYVVSGPKVPEGAYTGQLAISYKDSSGNLYSSSLPVGFLVTGSVQLSVQNIAYTTSGNSVSFSGTLLNQGSTSAYYLQVSGELSYASLALFGSSYVGEVDPNTPVPFSLAFTIPKPVSSIQGTLQLNVSYLNDFSNSYQQSIPPQTFQIQFNNSAISPNSTSNGVQTLQIFRYGIIIAIIAVLIIALIYAFRLRRKSLSQEKVI